MLINASSKSDIIEDPRYVIAFSYIYDHSKF